MNALVLACAVCGAGENDPSRVSYVVMSILISILPLALLGGIIGYVFVKSRAAEAEVSEVAEARVAEKP